MSGAMIQLKNLSKSYAGGGHAVAGLTLDIAQGEFMVIIGQSGSGKTTTLNMINRLTEPTSGAIAIHGEDALAIDAVALRRHIGFVFQDVGLFPHMTVAENIGITPRLLAGARPRSPPASPSCWSWCGWTPMSRRPPSAPSSRAASASGSALARALAARPRIMLMDEPFGALDPVTRDELAADYRAIHDRLGLTTVMVTHDMTEALLLADRIVVMREGRLIQTGTPQELLAGRRRFARARADGDAAPAGRAGRRPCA